MFLILEWCYITLYCWKVDWKSMDLSYLLEVRLCIVFVYECVQRNAVVVCEFFCPFQDKYGIHFANIVNKAKPVYGADMVQKAYNIDGDVRIKYKDQSDFENIARQFGIFEEWKVIQLFLFLTLERQCIILHN